MDASAGMTAGELLRKAREQKKITIEQANAQTKISPEVLRALEADDHGSFVSETYLRGFIKNYASFLGVEPGKVLSLVGRKAGSGDSGEPYWDVEAKLHEEQVKSPKIFRRFVLPALIIAILVLAALLIRENRKVKSLTTGAVGAPAASELAAEVISVVRGTV